MSATLLEYLRRQYAPPEWDAELIGRFAADRDGEAFAALVRRHGPAVLGLCRRWLSELDADDAFRALFVTLARKAARLRRSEALAGWLHGVALRVCRNPSGCQ
jgi:DNA-directed RNA polymerase specialized sigma24 family protein